METFFSSDLHVNHANIIQYSDRPWDTVEEMNEGLLERWNDRVRPEDRVFLLGDVAMGGLTDEPLRDYLRRLNGEKHLILGNHDQKIARHPQRFMGPGLFETVNTFISSKKIAGQRFTLSHFSLRVWDKSHHGAICLWGHSHGNLAPFGRSVDVGVDSPWITGRAEYRPFHVDEILEFMEGQDIAIVDHHGVESRDGEA